MALWCACCMHIAGRNPPDPRGDDRHVLAGWLDWQRATVIAKCDDLDDNHAQSSLIPSSPELTISRVVAHLTRVEHSWFVRSFVGGAAPDGQDWTRPSEPIAELVAAYAAQCDLSRQITAAHELDDLEKWPPTGLPPVSLRWILGHLIEETARHLGHLDLLRELTDGVRGY